MIGRLHHLVVDCPYPRALAEFWSAVLGQPITYEDDDFVVVAASGTTSGLGFQRSPDARPSTWPDPAVPQQIHLDLAVDDLAAASRFAESLGARWVSGPETPDDFVVFLDPSGHPFCLCV